MRYSKSEIQQMWQPGLDKLKYTAALCAAIPNIVAAAACGLYVYDSHDSMADTFDYARRHNRCVELRYLYGTWALVGWKSYRC
jgi:hypothetical protein